MAVLHLSLGSLNLDLYVPQESFLQIHAVCVISLVPNEILLLALSQNI